MHEWFVKLYVGHKNTEDDEHSVHTENINEIYSMILDDHKIKIIQITDTLKISKEHLRYTSIAHEHLVWRGLLLVKILRFTLGPRVFGLRME